jgi:hypothetical protein
LLFNKDDTVKYKLIIIIIFACCSYSIAQEITKTVRGKVVDRITNQGLSGASIKLINENFTQGTNANDAGEFEIQNVPTGRYKVIVSYTGYAAFDEELLVIAGHEPSLKISLNETAIMLIEVEVAAIQNKTEDVPGLRSYTIEKTMRIPANFFDPVRMATTHPGVVAANDQANAIIIKGNSPNGLLWRLNGLDIVNPNHLSNAGTLSDKPMANGGGVNILSAQMLDKTDLYTGAFPVNYGNALSGIIDMRLRDGNHDRFEYTAQASLIGLDLSAEGPINKNHNTSFLANYRYSTIGLLSKMGVDFGGEVIDFQDFSFNLNTRTKKGATLSFFGFGGLSSNTFKEKDQAEWEEDKDHNNISYEAKTYALGMNYAVPFKRSGLSFSLGYSGNIQDRNLRASSLLPSTETMLSAQQYSSSKKIVSSNIQYEKKIGKKSSWQIGMITDLIHDDLESLQEINNGISSNVDGKSDGMLWQPYVSANLALSAGFNMQAGLRYVNYTFNGSHAFEPRVLFNYHPSTKTSFDIAYGIVSQMQLPSTYYASGNRDLGFTKAHHFNIGYHQSITSNIKINTELYYQQLFDIPVEKTLSSFSAVNLLENFAPANLSNTGIADNYGMNISVEKSFYNENYFMAGGGYYESTYAGSDGKNHDTRFNGKYTVNAIYGKEWKSTKKNRTIGLNTRLLYLGGLRETPIDVTASKTAGETVRDESRPFENKLSDYFRIDLRLSFRKNKIHYTRTFAIDLQNVTGQQNEAYNYYDFTQQKVVTKYQLGLIPVLVYRIDF